MFRQALKTKFGIFAGLGYSLHGLKPQPQDGASSLDSRLLASSLHYNAAHGSNENIENYINKQGVETFNKMLFETTCRGNNPLHLAAKYNSPGVMKSLAENMDDKATSPARQMNDDALFPILLVKENKTALCDSTALKKLSDELLPSTLKHNLPNINRQIDINKMLSEHPYNALESNTYNNLKLSALAINQTRHMLKKSNTHPTVNLLSKSEYNKISNNIGYMRYQTKPWPFWERSWEEQFAISVRYAKQSKLGNCGEYSRVTIDNLKKIGIKTSCELYYLKYPGNEGSHVFVVIGRDSKSDASDYTTWGDNAVVCDAWSGETFLANQIPDKLQFWSRLVNKSGEFLGNVCGPFNPKVHSLSSELKFDFSDERYNKYQSNTLR